MIKFSSPEGQTAMHLLSGILGRVKYVEYVEIDGESGAECSISPTDEANYLKKHPEAKKIPTTIGPLFPDPWK